MTLGERDDTLVVVVSDNGASAEGGRNGSINDVRMWNGIPAGRRELQARIDEFGRPDARTTTTRGAGPWPATRPSVVGSARCTRVAWPTRASSTGPRALAARGEIRHQFAHAIDIAPTVLDLIGVGAPSQIDGVEQSPIEGASLAAVLGDADAPATARHPVLRDARQPGDLPRRLEGGDVQTARRHVRRRHRSRRAVRRRSLGALPRRVGLLGVPRPGRPRARAAGRDGRAVVERGARPSGAAARQPTAGRAVEPSSRPER